MTSLELALSCDVPQEGIGIVLFYVSPGGIEKPVTFISGILSETEQKYSENIKEVLPTFWAV